MVKVSQYRRNMDPRHPEQSIVRLKELMKQYDRVEQDMKKASTSAQLAQLEREGGLVIQEICLVAPRIHEAMMQTSRNRRSELTKTYREVEAARNYIMSASVVTEDEPKKEEPVIEEKAEEAPAQTETNPKQKKSSKKAKK